MFAGKIRKNVKMSSAYLFTQQYVKACARQILYMYMWLKVHNRLPAVVATPT